MDIFLKASSADMGTDLGPGFDILSDSGSVSPNFISKEDLLAGKILSVDENASQLTLTSTGECDASAIITIEKDQNNCFAITAASYKSTSSRLLEDDYSVAPFRRDTIDSAKILEIRNSVEYQKITLDIFGIIINFIVGLDSTDENSNLLKTGVGNSDHGEFTFYFTDFTNGDTDMQIIGTNSNVSYKIAGNSQQGYKLTEWLTSDFIVS
jgi:hypothetical protein